MKTLIHTLMMAIGVVALLILIMDWLPGDTDMLGWGLKGPQGVVIFLTVIGLIALGLTLLVAAWREGKLGGRYLAAGILRLPFLGESIRTIAFWLSLVFTQASTFSTTTFTQASTKWSHSQFCA